MKIRRRIDTDPPEINLIPMIDILLVIVIFLVVSTSFVRQSQLKVELPGVNQKQSSEDPQEPIRVRIGKDGNYSLGAQSFNSEANLRVALSQELAKPGLKKDELKAILEADATATHQSVVTVMDMLASLGINRVSIATAAKR